MAGAALLSTGALTLRFAIAARSPLRRAGLVDALVARELEVVMQAASIADLRAAAFGGADVALADVSDVGDGGRRGDDDNDEIDSLAGVGPHLVLLAAPGDERTGEWLIDGHAVLPREASAEAIEAAAAAMQAGLVATHPAFAAEALRFERVGERRAEHTLAGALTPRERQVLLAMSHGLGNREIGGSLGISAHTAKFHVAQIISKLQAQSRAHAVAKALRAGLVDV